MDRGNVAPLVTEDVGGAGALVVAGVENGVLVEVDFAPSHPHAETVIDIRTAATVARASGARVTGTLVWNSGAPAVPPALLSSSPPIFRLLTSFSERELDGREASPAR